MKKIYTITTIIIKRKIKRILVTNIILPLAGIENSHHHQRQELTETDFLILCCRNTKNTQYSLNFFLFVCNSFFSDILISLRIYIFLFSFKIFCSSLFSSFFCTTFLPNKLRNMKCFIVIDSSKISRKELFILLYTFSFSKRRIFFCFCFMVLKFSNQFNQDNKFPTKNTFCFLYIR